MTILKHEFIHAILNCCSMLSRSLTLTCRIHRVYTILLAVVNIYKWNSCYWFKKEPCGSNMRSLMLFEDSNTMFWPIKALCQMFYQTCVWEEDLTNVLLQWLQVLWCFWFQIRDSPEMGLQLLQQKLTFKEPGLTLYQSYLLFSEVYLSLFPDIASLKFAEVGELGQMFADCGWPSGW